jgi:hypothetical protein
MDREPDLFMAHLCANNAAANLLQAHSLLSHSGRGVLVHRTQAFRELDKLAEMFGLELVPRVDVAMR